MPVQRNKPKMSPLHTTMNMKSMRKIPDLDSRIRGRQNNVSATYGMDMAPTPAEDSAIARSPLRITASKKNRRRSKHKTDADNEPEPGKVSGKCLERCPSAKEQGSNDRCH